jgi:hypothetical protein
MRRYSIRQVPKCGNCGKELPEGRGKQFVRSLHRNRRVLLSWTALIAFLPTLIGAFVLLEHFTSRTASLARNPPNCGVPLPPHGVYWQYGTSSLTGSLTIKTSAGENYFVKLVDVRDDATKIELFIHGGTILGADVPLGTFKIKYASGLVWCGENELFGSDTVIEEADKTFDFSSNNEWTVELIAQRGGNLRTKSIPRSAF